MLTARRFKILKFSVLNEKFINKLKGKLNKQKPPNLVVCQCLSNLILPWQPYIDSQLVNNFKLLDHASVVFFRFELPFGQIGGFRRFWKDQLKISKMAAVYKP